MMGLQNQLEIELESESYELADQRMSNLEKITTLKYFKKNLVPFGEYTPYRDWETDRKSVV